jgi:protein-tyrosine phosphatase
MFDSILIVCAGNICRSPVGERLMMKYLPAKKITSAGINALVGQPADATTLVVAKKNGLSLEGHVAKQIDRNLCLSNDLILVMEKKQMDSIYKISAETRGKIMLFGHWNEKIEISDPYNKSLEAHEYVYKVLNICAQKWANVLCQ